MSSKTAIPDALRLSVTRAICLTVITFAIGTAPGQALELVGVTVTPHLQSPEMRYRRPADPQLGARVELYLLNKASTPMPIHAGLPVRFDDHTPAELLASGDWAWHDTPAARPDDSFGLPSDALAVWSFNSKGTNWGVGTSHTLDVLPGEAGQSIPFELVRPAAWLSSVTFLGHDGSVMPDHAVVHIANRGDQALTLRAVRFWLPATHAGFLALVPGPWKKNLSPFPNSGIVEAGGRGGFTLETGPLPLTYCALEVQFSDADQTPRSLWAHLRIKREVFDLGGGWVASSLGGSNTLQAVPYLKTLHRMHINAGMHQHVPGYSDTPLFDAYPMKYMNRLQPFEQYDTEAMLPRIHAVEFLGEPQYGGGRPVPPQEVFAAFLPYGPTRLATSVTHSEERIWRYYAGLSDYPHYDAYRVTAPAPDSWTLYDRWNGEQIRWGAPLETIGDMTRSLRELNRPRPIACWSQGAHAGWRGYGGRARSSPTPDELRSQAYHALSSRITSLYWFNLSLESLVKFRDLIEPITKVNREIRLMEELLLEGAAFEYRRELDDGQPAWDLASVTGPNGGLFFALDLAYVADPEEKAFKFRPRFGTFSFRLPDYLAHPAEVFRVAADGIHNIPFTLNGGRLEIRDEINVGGIYVVAPRAGMKLQMQKHHLELLRFEESASFDPAGNDADFEKLKEIIK